MKRAISSVIFAGAAIVVVNAQGSFTIVRPFDGSKVREMVRVLFPKNSVPESSGYVGIFVDGEFIEAVAPKLSPDKKYYEYLLDTKSFEDGTHKLEAKLYVDYSNQPRIVDTSSVDITIANRSSIPVPEDGFKLRYKFNPGTERVYRMQERVIVNAISEEDQKKQGSRPFQLQEDGESLKMLYACDNAYGNGDGLIRMQVLPDKGVKGREFSYIATQESNGEPSRFYPENMSAVYMRVTPTGREVFGSIPEYFGLEGNTGTAQRLNLYADFPLPTLPSKAVKPGDSWQANFQLSNLDMDNLFTMNSVVRKVPARGELIGVEWEMGHPCAKIKNTIAEGTAVPKGAAELKQSKSAVGDIADSKVSVEETVWFALDTGVVVKYFRDITVEGKVNFGLTGGQAGGAGNAGGPGPGGPTPGGSSRSGGKGGGAMSPGDFRMGNFVQGPPPPGVGAPPQSGRGQRGGPMGAPTGQGGTSRGQFNSNGGFQGAQSSTGYVRQRVQFLFVLEK